jgi:sialate O-acetylesterase
MAVAPSDPESLKSLRLQIFWDGSESASVDVPVGYFFGREIHKSLKVPVGMIAASQGATQIEIWTAPEGLAEVPSQQPSLAGITATADAARKKTLENLDSLAAVIPQARAALAKGRPLPPALAMGSPVPTEGGPVLYNGMIYPLVPFAIRGALWYQGESNCGDGMLYYDKMKALIGGWRKIWQQGDFPFYFVQITPNRNDGSLPFLL